MAVIAKVTLRGVTSEQYDAVRRECGWIEESPAGGLTHLTWWEGSDCCNIDAWDSEEAFQAFGERRLGPAMAAAGVAAQPEVTFYPAHEVLAPRPQVIADTATPAVSASSNVATIRSGYAAFAAGDVPKVLSLFDDAITWYTPDSVRFGGRFVGPAEVGGFFSRLPDNFAVLQVEPGVYLESGDTVTVLGMHHGVTVSGTAFDLPWVHVWSFARGKVTSFTEYMDTVKLNAALDGTLEAENKLRRMFDEVINAGRLDVADELFADDFVDHGPMGDIAGREAFKGLVSGWRAAVPDVHCEVEDVSVVGDRASWIVRTTGTHTGDGLGFPATGKRFETVSANIGIFRDGKAVEHWSEQGMLSMLTQIGMLPTPAPA
jgi:ketosteroid isomerase-like protein/predicted ester cyclase